MITPHQTELSHSHITRVWKQTQQSTRLCSHTRWWQIFHLKIKHCYTKVTRDAVLMTSSQHTGQCPTSFTSSNKIKQHSEHHVVIRRFQRINRLILTKSQHYNNTEDPNVTNTDTKSLSYCILVHSFQFPKLHVTRRQHHIRYQLYVMSQF